MKSKSAIYLIIILVIIGVFLGVKIYHDNKVVQLTRDYRIQENLNLRDFQYLYDSTASQLYNDNVPIAIQFELLSKPELFFEETDTIIRTFIFASRLSFTKYSPIYFEYLKQVAEIDVNNKKIIFEIHEGINRVSDEFSDIGDEWRYRMSEDEIERFSSVSTFMPDGCVNNYFQREKRSLSYGYLSSYRDFLNYYKSKIEDQQKENRDNIIDYLYVIYLAKENLYEFQKEQLLPIIENHIWDSIKVNHGSNVQLFDDIVFPTYKLNVPNFVLREKIESMFD